MGETMGRHSATSARTMPIAMSEASALGAARHIGRVGALAVALGLGAAVATTPGMPSATPTDTTTNSTDSPASATGGAVGGTDSTPGLDAQPSTEAGSPPPS